MKVQYLATGLTSGHGPIQLRGTGMPVKVAGMTVAPGDIVHMDQVGACKFPATKLPEVLKYATELIGREKKDQAKFRSRVQPREVEEVAVASGIRSTISPAPGSPP